MKTHLMKLKAELKVLAQEIKTLKPSYRQSQSFLDKTYPTRHDWNQYNILKKNDDFNNAQKTMYSNGGALGRAYTEFRSKHIAYCLLRGRTIEQIEPKLRDPYDYSHQYIRKLANDIVTKVMEEVNGQVIHTSQN